MPPKFRCLVVKSFCNFFSFLSRSQIVTRQKCWRQYDLSIHVERGGKRLTQSHTNPHKPTSIWRTEAGGGVAPTLYGVAAPSIACARRDCVIDRPVRDFSRLKTRARRCTDGGLAPADRPNLNRPRVPMGTLTRDCKETAWGGTTSVTSARPARPASGHWG